MKLTERYALFTLCACLVVLSLSSFSLWKMQIYTFSDSDKIVTAKNGTSANNTLQSIGPRYIIVQNGMKLTADEFRSKAWIKTGNTLIDDYGKNNLSFKGENGVGVYEHITGSRLLQAQYRINVLTSDLIPLNRIVPDSRFKRCPNITYDHDLPTASVIIPFYNEWPSILLRTVYSIINRTPRHLLWEILLIDDSSDLVELKETLDVYVTTHFPRGLVRVIRLSERVGLIKARQHGCDVATGDVIVIFDSHMEVNIDWLQPLLTLIKQDRKTIALGTLDYINAESFEYAWYRGHVLRYGFDWRMVFFETFFRPDNFGPDIETPKKAVVMVGAGFAVDRKYFAEIGGFDDGMKVWGGENIELAWRTWMCGGRLMHAPCSKIGHIARGQPYKFPGGRRRTEVFNYKRALQVWMEPEHHKFVYDTYPEMRDIDTGDLSKRFALKDKLQCKNFSWFLENIWPELFVYDKDVLAWGSAQNPSSERCLDNHMYLFKDPRLLYADQCHFHFASQGFSWTTDRTLRTSLQCVVVKVHQLRPQLQDCIIGPRDRWIHYKNGFLKHELTGLCMDLDEAGPFMDTCRLDSPSQMWTFNTYNY
ncbi:inactive polypeptide N-acetylgalactosaminyltransferase-like protein 5 [Gigantopelta aegis]|uniref:inactive polypeptide N-acetylgalactosaminyltransferase-like protein 5 n=1 Tax=Gigantopelta aegis TaxID=1735272 RepID=UPI001B8891E5|nr:inactive polypeptide N-acetylgalactosaminyltransferase-like protein 5 [Gigantopelta aegis]